MKTFNWMWAALIVFSASVFTACTSNDDNLGTGEYDRAKKALLIILDGWGNGDKSMGDVIAQADKPYIDYLKANYPHTELLASGEYVGLPDGEMGNSETGHLNIGAGRIVYQDLAKTNCTRTDNSIKENLSNTLGEYIASKGMKQLHVAETEKYAHVTTLINGGREEPFEGEDRILVNSPKVATYDLKPEMSAFEVKDKLVEALKTDKYDWIVVNFANVDMVGHTGVYTAIESAVKVIDQCLNEVVETAKTMGYETIITADYAINYNVTRNTTHSVNPVPIIYVTEKKNVKLQNGILADVAPSILHIMGLEQPKEMTGKSLIKNLHFPTFKKQIK